MPRSSLICAAGAQTNPPFQITNRTAYLDVYTLFGCLSVPIKREILVPHISNQSQCKPMPNRAKESFRFVSRSLLDSNDLPIALNICVCAISVRLT